jgi:hypothetical protein
MPRPKKGDPELLLVSFCDIVTVTMASLFMALLVVIDQSMRTPTFRHTPIAEAITNVPVYFECRANQVFPIDRVKLAEALRNTTNTVAKTAGGTNTLSSLAGLGQLMMQDIGNEYYQIDTRYLLLGQMALLPRTNAIGMKSSEVTNKFGAVIAPINKDSQYLVFLVRDDSFSIFRKARDVSAKAGFRSGWEYLGRDEPITFVGAYARIKSQ